MRVVSAQGIRAMLRPVAALEDMQGVGGAYGEYRQHSDGVLFGHLNRRGSVPLTLSA